MKYYSETLNKIFDTEEALIEAETEEIKRLENKEIIKQEIFTLIDNVYSQIEQACKKLAEIEEVLTDEEEEEILTAIIGKLSNMTRSITFSFFN